ncbi:MAG: DUF2946 family protein [Rickettsiales bacterium]
MIAGITGWLYVIALLIPFFAVYDVPNAEAASRASLFGDSILICTEDGFKWVKTAELAEGKHQPVSSDSKHFSCGLCVLAATGIAFAAMHTPVALLSPAEEGQSFRPSLAVLSPVESFATESFDSRAPPEALI